MRWGWGWDTFWTADSVWHERDMRSSRIYLLIVKYLIDIVSVQPQYIRLDGFVTEFFLEGGFKKNQL